MRKPAFCKGADQLHGNLAADKHLCFLATYIVQSLYFLNANFMSNHLWGYILVGVGCPETPNTDFLMM